MSSESKKGVHQIGQNSFLFYNTPEIFYSISFEIDEPKIIQDENGKAIDVVKRVREEGEMLIEDFMIAANECVASHIYFREHDFKESFAVNGSGKRDFAFCHDEGISEKAVMVPLEETKNKEKIIK